MAEVLDGARPLIDMLWESATQGSLDTPERRAALETRLDETLARIGEERVRKHYRAAVAERLSRLWWRRP